MIESTVECAILVELIVPSFFCAACEKRFAVYVLSDDKPARRLANCPLCGAFAIRDGSQHATGVDAPQSPLPVGRSTPCPVCSGGGILTCSRCGGRKWINTEDKQ